MPIEFNCPKCQRLLRTPDDSGGKQSRCPQCGHIQTIPAAGTRPAADGADDPPSSAGRAAAVKPGVPDLSPPPDNPFGASATAAAGQENPFGDSPPAANPYAAPRGSLVARSDPRATILPGIFLIVVTTVTSILLILGIGAGVVEVGTRGAAQDDVVALVFLSVSLVVQILIFWGGINMVRCRGYTMAFVAAMAAVVPLSLCWCFHMPLGVWAMITLNKPGMRDNFAPPERS